MVVTIEVNKIIWSDKQLKTYVTNLQQANKHKFTSYNTFQGPTVELIF